MIRNKTEVEYTEEEKAILCLEGKFICPVCSEGRRAVIHTNLSPMGVQCLQSYLLNMKDMFFAFSILTDSYVLYQYSNYQNQIRVSRWTHPKKAVEMLRKKINAHAETTARDTGRQLK